ncbi:sigma factor-like helix-turn-helix DNA-binding protein [Patulibacter sp. SYSU D01012]|uniref:sigma factor-like helix-turn-helix DNA-binding protein n=1 Tax=Patulibacter sp. SYSU D01012 TaxID=2817381 RepID=UPI001B316D6D|nr:sigma factor-like helix-turn-helix DNA-binding protein [Patulibacter sp. SYSU D01012]
MSGRGIRDLLAQYAALDGGQRALVREVVCCGAPVSPDVPRRRADPTVDPDATGRLVRRVGGVWRYSDKTLSRLLFDAMRDIGHPPTVAEFDAWRADALARAETEGVVDFHLPSTAPYRRRWGSWLAALAHHGAEGTAVQDSADAFVWRRAGPDPDVGLQSDLRIAELARRVLDEGLPLSDELVTVLVTAWEQLPRRSRFILTDRLELLGPHSTYKVLGATLGISGRRAHQVHREAFMRLCRDVLGLRSEEDAQRAPVQTLRLLAR